MATTRWTTRVGQPKLPRNLGVEQGLAQVDDQGPQKLERTRRNEDRKVSGAAGVDDCVQRSFIARHAVTNCAECSRMLGRPHVKVRDRRRSASSRMQRLSRKPLNGDTIDL